MEKSWTVVHFQTEDSVEAVPSGWLYNNQCYWPPFSNEKLYKCIKNNEEPNTCWPLHDVKIFRNSTYSNYLTARNKARRAEETSDLNSDTDKSIRKKLAAKVLSSSESDSDIPSGNCWTRLPKVPNPPVVKKANPTNKDKGKESGNLSLRNLGKNMGNFKFQEELSSANSVSRDTTDERFANMCICCKQHPGHLMGDIIRKQNIIQQFLKQINDTVDDIKIKLENMSVAPETSLPRTNSFFKKFNFPINDQEELEKFDEFLQEEENYREVVWTCFGPNLDVHRTKFGIHLALRMFRIILGLL